MWPGYVAYGRGLCYSCIAQSLCTQALHRQYTCLHVNHVYTYVYSVDTCRTEQWNMCSVCYTLLLEKWQHSQHVLRSASNCIIQGDVVFIEVHLLQKTSCMRPDVLHAAQNTISILGMSTTMVGTLILPDITEILRDPCSSCAIRSASSIKSIPKPCIQDSILFPQFAVRCAN